MKFQVWHADPPNFLGDHVRAAHHPAGYIHVADVECENVTKVFALTNHIDGDWRANPGVTALIDRRRSTSVGDIVVNSNGKRAMVDWMGFWELDADGRG